jgi:hypothetical protein
MRAMAGDEATHTSHKIDVRQTKKKYLKYKKKSLPHVSSICCKKREHNPLLEGFLVSRDDLQALR